MKTTVISLLSLLLVATVKAETVVISANYLQETNVKQQLGLECQKLKYQYLEVLNSIDLKREEIKTLLQGEKKLHEPNIKLIEAIKDLRFQTKKMLELAAPVWNIEKWDLNLKWPIPRKLFFDNLEDEFKRHKQNIALGFLNDESIKFLIAYKAPKILSVKLLKANFMGKENEDITTDFHLFPYYNSDEGLKISYNKKATTLEMCQLAKTIQFQVQVDYHIELSIGYSYNETKYLNLVWLP